MGRGESLAIAEMGELLSSAERELPQIRSTEELNQGDPKERLLRARELSEPGEISLMWETNHNSSKILRVLASNPEISEVTKARAITKISEIAREDPMGFGKMDRARGMIEGLTKNPSLTQTEIGDLLGAVSHLKRPALFALRDSHYHRTDRLLRTTQIGLAFYQPNSLSGLRSELVREILDAHAATVSPRPRFDHATHNDLASQAWGIQLLSRSELRGVPRGDALNALLAYPRIPEACVVLQGLVRSGAVQRSYVYARPRGSASGDLTPVGSIPRLAAQQMGMRRTRAICSELMEIHESEPPRARIPIE